LRFHRESKSHPWLRLVASLHAVRHNRAMTILGAQRVRDRLRTLLFVVDSSTQYARLGCLCGYPIHFAPLNHAGDRRHCEGQDGRMRTGKAVQHPAARDVARHDCGALGRAWKGYAGPPCQANASSSSQSSLYSPPDVDKIRLGHG
jgi:hypothetical protein